MERQDALTNHEQLARQMSFGAKTTFFASKKTNIEEVLQGKNRHRSAVSSGVGMIVPQLQIMFLIFSLAEHQTEEASGRGALVKRFGLRRSRDNRCYRPRMNAFLSGRVHRGHHISVPLSRLYRLIGIVQQRRVGEYCVCCGRRCCAIHVISNHLRRSARIPTQSHRVRRWGNS